MTYQFLKCSVQLADGIFKYNADGTIGTVPGCNSLHDISCIFLIFLGRITNLLFDDTDGNDFVSVIDQFVEKPLKGVVGVAVLIHSNHKSSRPTSSLIPLMSDIERQRRSVVLCRFTDRDIVECDMILESVGQGFG